MSVALGRHAYYVAHVFVGEPGALEYYTTYYVSNDRVTLIDIATDLRRRYPLVAIKSHYDGPQVRWPKTADVRPPPN